MKTTKQAKSLALTKTALANALSISRQSLYTYLKKEGAPVRGHDGWDAGAVARFIASVARSESTLVATSDELRSAKLREIGLRCDMLALEIRQKSGGYLDAADYGERLKKFAIEVRYGAWEHWVQQFPYDIRAHYSQNECEEMIDVRQMAKIRFDSFMGGCHELSAILGPNPRNTEPTKPSEQTPPAEPPPPDNATA
jgi:hypothetical protein